MDRLWAPWRLSYVATAKTPVVTIGVGSTEPRRNVRVEELIAPARAYPDDTHRIVVAFQPHRYTRTRDLMDEFGQALAAADEVVLTAIYAASEEPLPGITIETLAEAVNRRRSTPVHLVPKLEDMSASVADLARPGDLVLTLGAGSIASLAGQLVAELERRHGKGGAR